MHVLYFMIIKKLLWCRYSLPIFCWYKG